MIVDVGESCGSTQKNVESCSKKKIRTWKAGAIGRQYQNVRTSSVFILK